jgi:hypothetical protein
MRDGTRKQQVFVLPAFETAHHQNETRAHELADAAAAMKKDELAKLVKKRLVYQFALYLFWQVCGSKRCCEGRGVRRICSGHSAAGRTCICLAPEACAKARARQPLEPPLALTRAASRRRSRAPRAAAVPDHSYPRAITQRITKSGSQPASPTLSARARSTSLGSSSTAT